MSVRIVHASIDERGKISGGALGDNSSKECCVRSWYNKPWQFCLRFKDRTLAEKAVNNAVYLANSNLVGYDQSNRNSLNTELKKVGYDVKKLKTLCETDCSAFMSVVCQTVGIPIPYSYGNAPTTVTMVSAFNSTGEFDVLVSATYLTMDKYLKKGDILVKAGSHTVMVIDDGSDGGNTTHTVNYKPNYKYGQTYTTNTNLFVRLEPKGEKKLLSELTASAKKCAYDDGNGYAILRKDTRVTCKDIKEIGNQTWMKIPSGWICAINVDNKVYVE